MNRQHVEMLKYNILEVVKCIRDKRQETRDKRRWIRGLGAVGLFALMGFALLTGGKASAKEKVSDFWKNAGHLKQVKEEAVDDAIPTNIVKYANNKYKSLLLAASQYDEEIGKNTFETSLGEPFVILNDSNEEVYYFPVIANNKIIYVISVINTTDGLTMSGSYEMVDMLNAEMNDTTLIVYDKEEEIIETVDITDEEYEEVVEEAAEFVENMEAVDVEKMKEKSNNCIVDEYSYTPKYSYNQTSGSTTGKICALYNQQYQGDLPICWASTVATIVNYRKGIYITGKDVCDAMFTGYVGKNVTVATEALQRWGCNYTVTWKQLAWDVIVKNINKKYPIYVHASNATAGKGHAVTLYGYMNNNSSRYITIWNTASNNYQTITYKSSDTSFISSSKVFVWSRSSSMY